MSFVSPYTSQAVTEIFVSLICLPSLRNNPEFQHKVTVYPKLLDLSELFTCCGLLPSAVGLTVLICYIILSVTVYVSLSNVLWDSQLCYWRFIGSFYPNPIQEISS